MPEDASSLLLARSTARFDHALLALASLQTPTDPMSEEDQRRRHPRIATQQPVWVEGQDVRIAAEVRNMSKGGMFVVSKAEPPAIGATLEIKFHDPLEGEVHLRTEVVWRDENTMTSKLGLRVLDSEGMDTFDRVVSRYEASSALKNVRIDSSAPTQRPPKPEPREPDDE